MFCHFAPPTSTNQAPNNIPQCAPFFLPPRKSGALDNKKPRTEFFHVSIITQSVHSTKTCVSPVSETQATKGYEFTGGICVMVNTFAIIKLFLSQLTVRTQQRRAY